MTPISSPEIYWLVIACAMTGLMWIPYIVRFIAQIGLVPALVDPTGEHPLEAAWAQRAKRAHANAVENLVVFAPLALIVSSSGLGDDLTAIAAKTYVAARVAHYLIYITALPVLRTLAFAVGVGCQAVLALRLLGLI